ncbi:MAG TPA: hypothetical protein VKP67_24520 [Xanthobacteraceae bacterium]|nr:hypothetical protein [Xanthobacteraceae bacterium]
MTRWTHFILPRWLRGRIYHAFLSRKIENLPSRRFLHDAIIPALLEAGCKSMLFVGVQSYNRECLRRCENASLWTIDVDPEAARWARADRHIVGDVCVIDQLVPPMCFDAVVMNGVFGYGINEASQARAAICALTKVAKHNAVLVVGWNPGRTIDFCHLAGIKEYLVPIFLGRMASHVEFPPDEIQSHSHAYDIYRIAA